MYSFKWLCDSMQNRSVVTLYSQCCKQTYTGQINGVAIEDGSGRNWLVTVAIVGGGVKTFFVKAE